MLDSPPESKRVKCLKLAIAANEAGIREIMSQAKEGMDLGEISSIFSNEVKAHGAIWCPQYGGPFVVDEKGGGPKKWERSIERKLEKNILFGVDSTVHYQGYYSDLGRYGFIGVPPRELLGKYEEIIETQDTIASLIKPGIFAEDVYEDSRHLSYEYEVHGIGREAHESFTFGTLPKLREATRRTKEKKIRFKLDSIICIELWAGFSGGIEDEYIIGKKGIQRISTLTRKIFTQK